MGERRREKKSERESFEREGSTLEVFIFYKY